MGWLDNYTNNDNVGAVKAFTEMAGIGQPGNPYDPILQLMNGFLQQQQTHQAAQQAQSVASQMGSMAAAAAGATVPPIPVSQFSFPATGAGQRPVAKAANMPLPARAKMAFDYLVKQGATPLAAAGIVGNIAQESGFDPTVTNRIGAYGLGQWLGARKQNLLQAAKQKRVDPADFHFQLDYLLSEPGESTRALAALTNVTTPEQAAKVWADKYERMGKTEANYNKRQSAARTVFNTRQTGGTVAVAATKSQQQQGLNNSKQEHMFFPVSGANVFRGLDSGAPVLLRDSAGKKEVLTGPQDKATMTGPVMERRLEPGNWLDKYQ